MKRGRAGTLGAVLERMAAVRAEAPWLVYERPDVLDAADAGEAAEVTAHGLEPIVAPTLVHLDEQVAAGLVERLLSATTAAA